MCSKSLRVLVFCEDIYKGLKKLCPKRYINKILQGEFCTQSVGSSLDVDAKFQQFICPVEGKYVLSE